MIKKVTYFTVTWIKNEEGRGVGREEQKEQMVGNKGLSNGDIKKILNA
jgi:hypothetical protein